MIKYFLLLTVVSSVYTSNAQAQSPNVQLALAKICVNEAGLQLTDDCAAIAEVLRARSSVGRVTMGIMRAYSGGVFDPARSDSRAWVSYLNPQGRKPQHWPENASWGRLRATWLAIYHRAGQILRGEITSQCVEPVDHWGGDMDTEAFVAYYPNARIIDCGNTENNFWSIQ